MAFPPEGSGEPKVDIFNLWEGANLKLKIRTVGEGQKKFPNYDMSTFDNPAPLADNDEAIEAVWKQAYPLKPFIDPSNFKSYDDLKSRLDRVLGRKEGPPTARTQELRSEDVAKKPALVTAAGDADEEDDAELTERAKFFDQLNKD